MLADRSAALEGIGLHVRARACGSRPAPPCPRWRRPGRARRALPPAKGAAGAGAGVCLDRMPTIEVSRPAQVLRQRRGGARRVLRGRAGRDVRPARPQRRRQDDHGRDPRGLPPPQWRGGAGARAGPRAARPRPSGEGRNRSAELRLLHRGRRCARRWSISPRPIPGPRDPDGDDRARWPRGEGRRSHEGALRRSAAPPRPGAGAGGRPGAGLPRRAHHGFDPAARRIAWDVVRRLKELGRRCC